MELGNCDGISISQSSISQSRVNMAFRSYWTISGPPKMKLSKYSSINNDQFFALICLVAKKLDPMACISVLLANIMPANHTFAGGNPLACWRWFFTFYSTQGKSPSWETTIWENICGWNHPSIRNSRVVFNTWVFPRIVVPQNGWFIRENPINPWMI